MTGIVTFGETMALLTPGRVGRLRDARSLHLSIGGAESNVAIAAACLGTTTAWSGRVGDDELGTLILRRLASEDVDVSRAIRDPLAPTSLMFKERRSGQHVRVTYYRRGGPGSRLNPDDLVEEQIAEASALHITGITPALSASARETVHAAIDLAASAGTLVSLDVNYRAALWPPDEATPALRRIARDADVLFAGADEAALLVDEGPPEEVAHRLAALGPREVVVKLGSRGAVAVVDGSVMEAPPVRVPVTDPVGAGDAFVAGYLAMAVRGAGPRERLDTGAACGAFAVTMPGDCESPPTWDDLALLALPTVER